MRACPERTVFRTAFTFLFITLAVMTWAYLTGAGAHPLKSVVSHHNQNRVGSLFEANHPSCSFNQLCTCSNPGPDLGIVTCAYVPFSSVPLALNNSRILTLSLVGNYLQVLDDRRFVRSGVRRLQIKENNLHYITSQAFYGLERSLWELDLGSNELTTVPSDALRYLTKLELIDLSGNQISELSSNDFRSLEGSLVSLSLADNLIHTINEGTFSRLSSLKVLDLSGNKIVEIKANSFPARSTFTTLTLSDNQLRYIPAVALQSLALAKLDLSENVIDSLIDLDPSGTTKLKTKLDVDELDLSRNRFTTIEPNSMNNFKSIDELILSSNPIDSVSDDAFRNSRIKELDLSNCMLSTLSVTALKGLESTLTKLDISFNNMSTIDGKLFKDFKQLKTLNLEENDIRLTKEEILYLNKSNVNNLNVIGNPVLKDSLKAIWKIVKLRSIRVSDIGSPSSITHEFLKASSPSIEEIQIFDSKRIGSIGRHAFSSIPGLKYLTLYGTHITSIDEDAFSDVATSLIRLKIEHGLRMSSISGKAIKKITSLKELDLSRNGITSISDDTFNSDSSIEYINLRFNKISKINGGARSTFPSEELPNLKRLLLGFNKNTEVTSKAFYALERLEYLELNENKITTIQPRAFVHLYELKVLDLAGNNIKTLQEEAFQNLPRLQILDLSHNLLTEIDFDVFDTIGTLSKLQIRLNHNSIEELISETDKQLQKLQQQQQQQQNQQKKKISDTGSVSELPPVTIEPANSQHTSLSMSTSSIEIIDLSHNDISYISPDFFYPICTTLLDLDLSHNELSNLTDEHFSGMTFLQRLDLSYNNMTYLESDVFQGLNGIQILTLNSNDLSEVPKGVFEECTKLRVLSLADNDLKLLDQDLFNETPLEILDLSDNKFSRFPSATLAKLASSLVTLDMSGNELSQLELRHIDCLSSLRNLNLANNNLAAIATDSFDKISNLLHLDISNNKIDLMVPKFLHHIKTSLISLNISHVIMDGLPEFNFPKLISLDVSDNQIRQIPPGFGENNSAVKSLDFSNNDFTITPHFNGGAGEAGSGFSMLNQLYLGNNDIIAFENSTLFRLNRLDLLDVSNTTVENIQLGFLKYLSLETLIIGPRESGETISKLLQLAPTIKHLHLLSDGKPVNFDEIPLPAKLSKLTISGCGVDNISKMSFEALQGKELELVLKNTGVVELSSKFYDTLGSVNQLKITIEGDNTALKSISNPNLKFHPSSSRPYLFDLDLDEDLKISCACGDSGWIKQWLGHWMQRTCSVASSLNQFLECQDKLQSLREIECRNNDKESLAESFANSDCGWESSARHLTTNYLTVLSSVFCLVLMNLVHY